MRKAAKGVLVAKASLSKREHHCLNEKVCNEFQNAGLSNGKASWGGNSAPQRKVLSSLRSLQAEGPEHRLPLDEVQLLVETPMSTRFLLALASLETEAFSWDWGALSPPPTSLSFWGLLQLPTDEPKSNPSL